MTMHTRVEEAVVALATLKGRANLAAASLKANCTCKHDEIRRECPWYMEWLAAANAADAYESRVNEVFPASEARAIEIRATALGMEPSFIA